MSYRNLRFGQELAKGSSGLGANDSVAGQDEWRLRLVDELGGMLDLAGCWTSLFRASDLRNRGRVGSFVSNIFWNF
jgi:hypothetical protein